jgi:hypothetical protein
VSKLEKQEDWYDREVRSQELIKEQVEASDQQQEANQDDLRADIEKILVDNGLAYPTVSTMSLAIMKLISK